MLKRALFSSAAALVLAGGMVPAVRAADEVRKYDFSYAYDPLTLEPILVCVSCWFWSCNC